MNVEYKRSINGSFVFVWDENDTSCDFQLEMLKNNDIPGILTCQTVTEDGINKARFCISRKQSVSVLYSKKKLDSKIVKEIIRSIGIVLDSTKEYMLSPEGIVFDFNHMYLDIDNNEIQYIFDIHSTASVFDSLHELSEIMISDVDHKDKVATQLAYKFFEITNDEDFTTAEIKSLLVEENKESYEKTGIIRANKEEKKTSVTIEKNEEPETESKNKHWVDYLIWILSVGIILWLLYDNFVRKFGRKALPFFVIIVAAAALIYLIVLFRKKGIKLNKRKVKKKKCEKVLKKEKVKEKKEPEKTIEPIDEIDIEKTGLLIIEDNRNPKLIGIGDCGIIIELTHFPYTLGKSYDYADGCIKDSYISRVHCQINKEYEDFYIRDLNSTNGTKLNGESIGPFVDERLNHGDRIKIGKVELVLEI